MKITTMIIIFTVLIVWVSVGLYIRGIEPPEDCGVLCRK